MSGVWAGVVLTVGAEYAVGFLACWLLAWHEYATARISPPRWRWYEQWWGAPIAGLVDGALWPVLVARLIAEAR